MGSRISSTVFCPLAHPRIFSKVLHAVRHSVQGSLRSLTGERFEMCHSRVFLVRILEIFTGASFRPPSDSLAGSCVEISLRGQCVRWRLSPISYSLDPWHPHEYSVSGSLRSPVLALPRNSLRLCHVSKNLYINST